MTTPTFKTRVSFTARRFLTFLKVFQRSKRGLFGIGIIIFYTVLALAAPILTPNDPTYGLFVSSDYATPIWFKLFGSQNIAEDVYPVRDSGFRSSSSLFGKTRDWNFTATSSPLSNVTLQYSNDKGRPTNLGGSGLGSAKIMFTRTNPRVQATTVVASLTKDFYYPFQAPPERFAANVTAWVDGGEFVPIDVRVFVANSSGPKFYLWVSPTVETTSIAWLTPTSPIDSYESGLKTRIEKLVGRIGADPAKVLFPTQSYYKYGVEILFRDDKPIEVNRNIVVYIDDLGFRLYGNTYGLMGTDHLGRDLFSQLVYGARLSLFVGLFSAVLSVVIGLLIGLISGYLGKVVDEILMRFTDALLVLPTLPLLLVLIAVLGPSVWNLIMVIGILGWMGFARMVRSQTLSLKERPFVEAAKAVGAGKWHIISRHVLPNVMNLVYVSLALSVPSAILGEAALSWLGLFDPTVVSWGRMLHDAQFFEGTERWWWIIPPGMSIALVSLSFILIGYTLDEILNPKLRQRR